MLITGSDLKILAHAAGTMQRFGLYISTFKAERCVVFFYCVGGVMLCVYIAILH